MVFSSILPPSILVASILTTVHGVPNADATAACNVIQARYPNQVANSGIEGNITLGNDYSQTRTDYWSAANADVKPACIFFPGSAEDISFAVKTLNQFAGAPWGVKGGGHNPNVGYSSTQDGVLIATKANMAYTTLDSKSLAHVGPGCTWTDIATALDPYGRAVVSGRLGVVGAAGLTLGGGLSFLSTEHGLVADNIVEYHVVLANGTMTVASKTRNEDIWYALKGGGNQFAIVTEFVMQTYAIGEVWGGHKIFSIDQKDALLSATHNLVSNYYDTKASVIVTFTTTLDNLVDIFVVFFYYNDPHGPGEILSEFDAIPALIDATQANRKYGDLLTSNSEFSLEGMRYLIRTGTIPNLPSAQGVDLYNYTFNSWYTLSKQYELHELDNLIFSLAFQPIPHQLARSSLNNANGVNLLGLDPNYGDKVFMEYDVSWSSSATDQLAATALTNVTQPVQEYARSKYAGVAPTNYQSGNVDVTNYNPMFMNDAMFNQDPLKSYPSDVYAKLQQIQKLRDPNGFLSKRQGGFKLT